MEEKVFGSVQDYAAHLAGDHGLKTANGIRTYFQGLLDAIDYSIEGADEGCRRIPMGVLRSLNHIFKVAGKTPPSRLTIILGTHGGGTSAPFPILDIRIIVDLLAEMSAAPAPKVKKATEITP